MKINLTVSAMEELEGSPGMSVEEEGVGERGNVSKKRRRTEGGEKKKD